MQPSANRTQKPGDSFSLTLSTLSLLSTLLLLLVPTISVDVTSKMQGMHGANINKTRSAFEVLTPDERQQYCDANYGPLFSNIDYELRRWNTTGITLELVQKMIRTNTMRSKGSASSRKGFVAGFRGGRAILPDKPNLTEDLCHHTSLLFIYMQTLVDLEQLFGPLIPDVDFVISTIDRPYLMADESGEVAPLPVMRFCKSPSHADIPVPIFHFMFANHNNDLGSMAEQINADFPWKGRLPTLFGRFSPYDRFVNTNDPYTVRLGENGTQLCDFTSYTATCPVRMHFIEMSRKHSKDLIDVATNPKIPMRKHAKYKYLVHLDGQGLSSRLDQLLPLGSLVFKEESGFYAFYHHMLKPYQHYIPFWKTVPEDIMDALDWAKQHDVRAQQIARQAQELAVKYLSREARACYWLKLFQAYAKLLRYSPAEAKGKLYMDYNLPVKEFIETVAAKWQDGASLKKYPFAP